MPNFEADISLLIENNEYGSGSSGYGGSGNSGYGSGNGEYGSTSSSSHHGQKESFGDKMIDKAAEYAKKQW